MSILSSQIDDLHEAECVELETAGHLSEWYTTVGVLQRDLNSGACTDNHWHLSLRRAKAQYERAALAHAAAAEKLAQIRASVAIAETIDASFDESGPIFVAESNSASFDESELTYIGPPPAGAEHLWRQGEHRTPALRGGQPRENERS